MLNFIKLIFSSEKYFIKLNVFVLKHNMAIKIIVKALCMSFVETEDIC
jgi:hypothetical protein